MTKDDESLQNEVEHLRLKAKAKLANFLREEDLNDVWHCAESIELTYQGRSPGSAGVAAEV